MSQLFYGLATLACPVGMGLMMWMMMRGNHGNNTTGNTGAAASAPIPLESQQQITQLRAEIDQLKGERAARGKAR